MEGGGDGEEKVLEGENEEMVGSDMKPCLIIVETCFDFIESVIRIEEEEEEKLKKASESQKMLHCFALERERERESKTDSFNFRSLLD